jgi:hypothetical protein
LLGIIKIYFGFGKVMRLEYLAVRELNGRDVSEKGPIGH